jgi:hypothetical protein
MLNADIRRDPHNALNTGIEFAVSRFRRYGEVTSGDETARKTPPFREAALSVNHPRSDGLDVVTVRDWRILALSTFIDMPVN